MNEPSAAKVVIFLSNLGGGGAEKVMVTIANGLVAKGLDVHLIAVNAVGVNLDSLADTVRLYDLKSRRAIYSVAKLHKTIQAIKPDAVLACANMPSFLICALKLFQKINCRVVISERAVLSITLANASFYVRLLFPFLVRFLYKYADEIISVSDDVALDLTTNFSVPKSGEDNTQPDY